MLAFSPEYDSLCLLPLPAVSLATQERFSAPLRLYGHHLIVHTALQEILFNLKSHSLPINAESLCIGASLHDIGKVKIPSELITFGHLHEALGFSLLVEDGLERRVARFALTHGQNPFEVNLEDTLVQFADNIWKGTRNQSVEDALIALFAAILHISPSEAFPIIDDAAQDTLSHSEKRLLWHSSLSTTQVFTY